ncbi:hypothetical protein [Micromonospora auratinigra]|uniref:Uncharacterized protein n=1 Tax=Micromonospora auratinigra TaxID=261654 RepID=A0A1A9A5N1_9ACTN|nr:hypothetical protein [Micromonospora auratinigra]SBT51427.1 hypothetical protein GA0070611_5175 [Micromonospora auratinigra]
MGTDPTAAAPGPLELSILDAAYDFPEAVHLLVQPVTRIVVDDGGQQVGARCQPPPERAAVAAALTGLLGRGLVEIVWVEGIEPVRRVPQPEWADLVGQDSTWQSGSALCVSTTPAGDRLVEAAHAGREPTDRC